MLTFQGEYVLSNRKKDQFDRKLLNDSKYKCSTSLTIRGLLIDNTK